MQISTVTQKGQITIPKNLRDKLGLVPYKKVELREEKGSIRILPAISIFDIAGKYKVKKGMSALKARKYMETHYFDRNRR